MTMSAGFNAAIPTRPCCNTGAQSGMCEMPGVCSRVCQRYVNGCRGYICGAGRRGVIMSVDGAAIDEKVPCRYVKSNPPKGQGLDGSVDRQ